MAIEPAQITPELLSWARERAGLSVDELSERLRFRAEKIEAWESGEQQPTFKQAERVARALNAPFGYFFLDRPPEEPLPIPDLRTVAGEPLMQPSTALRDQLREVTTKQAWYADYLRGHGEAFKLPFVGQFALTNRPLEIANNIRSTLIFERNARDPDIFFKNLSAAADKAGILVLKNGVVGSNTHRPLSVREFRGFAIADEIAPLVFVNGNDSPAARVFTLAHELAHIWLGNSGVSDLKIGARRRIEIHCNAVAGEVLVPEEDLRAAWNEGISWQNNADRLAERFSVSKLVIGRRAATLDLITREEYSSYYAATLNEFEARETSSGGDFYRTAKIRNGERLSRAVTSEALAGRMLLRDASNLLNMQPKSLSRFARELEG